MSQQSAKSSNFGPPAYSRKADENWNELPSFSEKPVKTEFETFEAIPQSFNEKSMQYYPEENEDQPLRFDRYDSKPIRFNPYSKNQEEESLRFQKYSEPRYKKPVRFQQERSEEINRDWEKFVTNFIHFKNLAFCVINKNPNLWEFYLKQKGCNA